MEGMTSCHGGYDMAPKTVAIGVALVVAGVLPLLHWLLHFRHIKAGYLTCRLVSV
jgi:hypothetical protein